MKRAVYLETSALLRALLREPGAEAIDQAIAGAGRVLTSRLTQVEADRALLRCELDERLTAGDLAHARQFLAAFWPKVDFIDLTTAVCELARRISPVSRLRSLDAIHLASFAQARAVDQELELLTFDDRLRAAMGALE